MPFGSSTGSKRARFMPEEPAVIVRGDGCRVWDAEGREFIDFRNSLGPVTLGYRFPAVDDAIRRQLETGIVYGHPHPIECEVAELMCEIVPCAEQARFLKTGGEACAACFRIARAHTGRERIVQIGYNGWLNSLAPGGQRSPTEKNVAAPPGFPKALSALHHACVWGDIDGVKKVFDDCPDEVACVAVSASYPDLERGREFYPALRELTAERGALLMFDEIVTGFRVALGGVQEYFGVTPDLAVFAKGMANGMPLSVYCGSRAAMAANECGSVSSTYGGETLSLAAAKAAIETYRKEDVVGHLWRHGERMWGEANDLLRRHGIPMRFKGLWVCPVMAWEDSGSAEAFWRALYRNGLSLYSPAYVTFSHKDADIEEALRRFDGACREAAGVRSAQG